MVISTFLPRLEPGPLVLWWLGGTHRPSGHGRQSTRAPTVSLPTGVWRPGQAGAVILPFHVMWIQAPGPGFPGAWWLTTGEAGPAGECGSGRKGAVPPNQELCCPWGPPPPSACLWFEWKRHRIFLVNQDWSWQKEVLLNLGRNKWILFLEVLKLEKHYVFPNFCFFCVTNFWGLWSIVFGDTERSKTGPRTEAFQKLPRIRVKMKEAMETSHHQPSSETEFAVFKRQNGNQIKINFLLSKNKEVGKCLRLRFWTEQKVLHVINHQSKTSIMTI